MKDYHCVDDEVTEFIVEFDIDELIELLLGNKKRVFYGNTKNKKNEDYT